jgi:hypothetical protein
MYVKMLEHSHLTPILAVAAIYQNSTNSKCYFTKNGQKQSVAQIKAQAK